MAYLGAGITRFNTADELTVTGDAKIDTNTLVVDSTNNRVGILNASPATAFDVTGTITADDVILSNDMTVADNGKVIFGAGSDLQIYHDGSNSYVDDTGTGRLYLRGNDRVQIQKYTGEDMITAIADGAVNLYHNNSKKFETSASGVDVTGTVTADDIILSDADAPSITLTDTTNTLTTLIQSGNSTAIIGTTTDHDLRILTNNTERMRIDSSGNVGIGETAPANLLHVKASDTGITPHASAQIVLEREGTNYLQFLTAETGTSGILFGDGSDVDVGGIKYDHNTTAMQFVTEAAERMRLDASGNVGIGTSSPSYKLQISGTADTDISIISGNSSGDFASIVFGDTDYPAEGRITYQNSDNAMRFWANRSQAMMIDASGNLLVGKTSAALASDGFEARAGSHVVVTNSGGTPLLVNRKTNDGNLALFYKDGTSVGSIQSRSGVVSTIILDPRSGGVGLTGTQTAVMPTSNTGVLSNAAMDLGTAGQRFKDLYLSGGAYLGGTGSANHLEDYEEGTWTPLLSGSRPGGGNPTYNNQYGWYTKIGNLIEFNMIIGVNGSTIETQANDFTIAGLPYTNLNSNNANFPAPVVWPQAGINNTTATQGYGALIQNNDTTMVVYGFVSGTGNNYVNLKYNQLSTSNSANTVMMRITGTYRTAS